MKDRNVNPPGPSPEEEGAIVRSGKGEILLYQTEDGRTRVECRFQDETIWLSQAMMSELYQTSKQGTKGVRYISRGYPRGLRLLPLPPTNAFRG